LSKSVSRVIQTLPPFLESFRIYLMKLLNKTLIKMI